MDYLGFAKFMENVYSFPLDELSSLKDDRSFPSLNSKYYDKIETNEDGVSSGQYNITVSNGSFCDGGESLTSNENAEAQGSDEAFDGESVAPDLTEEYGDCGNAETEGAKIDSGMQMEVKKVEGKRLVVDCYGVRHLS